VIGSRRMVVLTVMVLWGWVFAEALGTVRTFAFRDAAHFYYPLFQFGADQWRAGHWPLWNPYENGGSPLAADPAASLFYPGKVVFLLPINFSWAYKLYVTGHVLLGAFWAYRLARHFRRSVEAAGACAISYAFSGSVLYQYTNVIYLVGAAWLPAALLAADRVPRRRRVRDAVALGVVLALIVLGGDPQMAYHAGLLAVLGAVIRRKSGSSASRGCVEADVPSAAKQIALLLTLAAGVALALSAVQVLPAIVFARASSRADSATARSLWEIPGAGRGEGAGRRIADGRVCRAVDPDSHHAHVFHFSVGPWRWAEFVWPNVGGRQFPTHRRWIAALPAEGRVWTPGLYMGIVPLVLAIVSLRFRGGRAAVRWMSWTAVLGVLGSLGWYGLGWIAAEVQAASGAAGNPLGIGDPVGGRYWLMTVMLPGYVYFRYPAKLLVVAAVGSSALAAFGWDRLAGRSSPRVGRALAALAVLSLVGAAAAVAVRPWWAGWLAAGKPDVLFGPLDADGALGDLTFGLLQTAAVCSLAWWLARRMSTWHDSETWHGLPARGKTRPGWPCHASAAAMLVLVAVDLAVANGWMVVTAPGALWRQPSRMAEAIRADAARRGESGPVQVWRHPTWLPPAWRAAGSPDRLAEAVAWDRDTLWPKYNLRERIGVVNVYGSLMSAEHRRLLESDDPITIMRATGATYAILPEHDVLAGATRVEEDVPDASLWRLAPDAVKQGVPRPSRQASMGRRGYPTSARSRTLP